MSPPLGMTIRLTGGEQPFRVAGNKIVRFLIMTGINVRFVSVRRVGVSAWQEG